MIRQRSTAADIRAAVAAEAEARGVPAEDAEQITQWIAERELQNRRAEHAGR